MARIVRGADESTKTSMQHNKLLKEFEKSSTYKWFINHDLKIKSCTLDDVIGGRTKDEAAIKELFDEGYLFYEKNTIIYIFKKYDKYGFGLVGVTNGNVFGLYGPKYNNTFNDIDKFLKHVGYFNENGGKGEIEFKELVTNSKIRWVNLKEYLVSIDYNPGFLTDYSVDNFLNDGEKIIFFVYDLFYRYVTIPFYSPSFKLNAETNENYVSILLGGQYNGEITDGLLLFKEGFKLDTYNIKRPNNSLGSVISPYGFNSNSVVNVSIDNLNVYNPTMILNYNITSSKIELYGNNTMLLVNKTPNCNNIKSDMEIELDINNDTYTLYCNKGFYKEFSKYLDEDDDINFITAIKDKYFNNEGYNKKQLKYFF